MANLYSYVPSQVKVSVFGIDLVGLAKDSFISIERIDNLVSFRKAQDGSHTGFVDSYGSWNRSIRRYIHSIKMPSRLYFGFNDDVGSGCTGVFLLERPFNRILNLSENVDRNQQNK